MLFTDTEVWLITIFDIVINEQVLTRYHTFLCKRLPTKLCLEGITVPVGTRNLQEFLNVQIKECVKKLEFIKQETRVYLYRNYPQT